MSQPLSSPQPADQAMQRFTALTEQSAHLLDASVRIAAAEATSFLRQRTQDDARAIGALAACRTPLDLLAVEQTWLAARAAAWISETSRLALVALHEPEAAAGMTAEFRLPE